MTRSWTVTCRQLRPPQTAPNQGTARLGPHADSGWALNSAVLSAQTGARGVTGRSGTVETWTGLVPSGSDLQVAPTHLCQPGTPVGAPAALDPECCPW